MDNNEKTGVENLPNKGRNLRKALVITAISIVGVIMLLISGIFGFYILNNSVMGGYQLDSRLSLATTCRKAIDNSIADYYEAEGKVVPADKEYTIYATLGPDGLVSDPSNFFPGSVNQSYFSEKSNKPYYIIMKYKDGEFSEMWMSYKHLADDELIPYTRDEMQEQFGTFKGDRDVIVYIGYRSKLEYYH